jgi:hypothetical protein
LSRIFRSFEVTHRCSCGAFRFEAIGFDFACCIADREVFGGNDDRKATITCIFKGEPKSCAISPESPKLAVMNGKTPAFARDFNIGLPENQRIRYYISIDMEKKYSNSESLWSI